MFVEGGSLNAKGSLSVKHTGIQNENQYNNNGKTLYRNFVIKSYAVRVLSGKQVSTFVFISRGEISNQCGGGVYVGGSDSQNTSVVFGNETEQTGPSIITEGKLLFERSDYQWSWNSGHPYRNNGYITLLEDGNYNNWQYKQSKTGGHAVEVNNGTLTIWGGSYEAKHGEGILVKSGNVDIYGGSFLGADSYSANGGGNMAGPAASYSFKIFGGTVDVYDGSFGNVNTSGSGAFVMGESDTDMAQANFYGGSICVNGQAGFSIYEYADVTFAPTDGKTLTVEGYTCAIAVEDSTTSVNIEIRGGDFISTAPSSAGGGRDAIWYSNQNAKLVISGGNFSSNIRSGLWFQKSPYYGKVKLSGGTYIGETSAIGGTYSEYSILENGYRFNKNGNTRWTVVPN